MGNFTSLSARTKGQVYFSSGSLTVWQNMTVATGGRVSSEDASIKAAYLYVAPTGRLHRRVRHTTSSHTVVTRRHRSVLTWLLSVCSDGMGRGPGRGSYGSFGGSGGSYGGKGGKGSSQVSSNASYGSLFYPTSFGSQGQTHPHQAQTERQHWPWSSGPIPQPVVSVWPRQVARRALVVREGWAAAGWC